MKILLVLPPTAEKPEYIEPPLGLLYTGTALHQSGYQVEILDFQAEYKSAVWLLQYIKQTKIDVVGFGGISTCYAYVKQASILIRESLPQVHLIAGGVLSSVYDLLLKNTPIDVVCMKEGETTSVSILNRLKTGKRDFDDLSGVAFKKDGQVHLTSPQKFIQNIDEISLPEYDLLKVDRYLTNPMEDRFFRRNIHCRLFYKKGMQAFNIKTSRGCTNTCTFCYRHFVGRRQHSVDYVIKHLRYLREKYNVYFIRFGDELFTQDKRWVLDFCDRLIKENLMMFFVVHGARTENIDGEMVRALKNAGCVAIFVGFESGSQVILNQMKKNVTVEKNIEAVKTILGNGVEVLVQVVLGMPLETDVTIEETVRSLVKTGAGFENIGIGYAQAYPMTWLWQYALKNGFIKDQEKYLESVGLSCAYLVNLTKVSDEKWNGYKNFIYQEVIKNQFVNSNPFFRKLMVDHHKLRWAYIYYQDFGLRCLLRKIFTVVLRVIVKK